MSIRLHNARMRSNLRRENDGAIEENWASSVAFVSTLVMLGVEISTVKPLS
jgi:hypothetical protein